ncbi:MAG: hypothetical protein V1839_03165 [archaeon]
MDLTDENLDKLEKKLETDEKNIADIEQRYQRMVDFAKYAAREIGECTQRDEHTSNYKVTYELRNFHGFDIKYHNGLSSRGGAAITIEYDGKTVLHIEYWDIKELHVKTAGYHGDWEKYLEQLIDKKEEVVEQFKKKRGDDAETKKHKFEKLKILREKQTGLKEKADRLKVPFVEMQ